MKNIQLFLILLFTVINSQAQQQENLQKPKLVVGIVVDQMRYDYLIRFANKYGKDGFKRILKDGFSLENAHYNYVPTYTAVGHTSIYTGTTPDHHGIIGNNWYDKFLKKSIYCVDDNQYETVGNTGNGGKKSPYRMQTTTITDQLKLAQNMQGKTIGIAIKDRSSILPAGHTADAAYWFDGGSAGKWISSTYYMKNLPNWVSNFNANGKADNYLKQPWNTVYNINSYTESMADDNIYEAPFNGKEKTTFPYDIAKLRKANGNYNLLKAIPAGNSFTKDFAKAAIIGENLGKSNYTDFLAISFSSTDYIGHQFGVASKEVEDTYIRLDKDLADLFQFLDKQIGKDQYTLFLTADHAAVQVPAYLQSLKIPAGYINAKDLKNYVNNITLTHFKSDKLVENLSNFQIFLNKETLKKLNLDIHVVAQKIADEVVNYKNIYKAVTAKTMQTTNFTDGILHKLQKGYNQKFSGDVLLAPNFSTFSSTSRKGTTHGSGNSYDTHIPIIFYGKGIKAGVSKKRYSIVDIAPTIANLLQVEFPNGTNGIIVDEALK
ncbi:alkaline phosphatase family protein [Polaribacter pacificus]|uniref:Alkaline phosphatase family protein n=1 Tax=Polaribacter pacificus TaxID=1775173 RepID=A0A917HTK6_9FLAO|nr:alkaline phosphatase PafA [Polaribacter pacificus]GGG89552.1 alkaline phosphatase family protein [Polaribacter pacificus]